MKPEIFERIESPTFSAIINVASGYRQLLKAIAGEPEFVDLTKWAMQSSQDGESNPMQLYSRIDRLASEVQDEQSENPHDIAMAVYLLVLNEVAPRVASLAANSICACKNCWWAHQIARALRPADSLNGANVLTQSSLTKARSKESV
jgi:hypothetical protein